MKHLFAALFCFFIYPAYAQSLPADENDKALLKAPCSGEPKKLCYGNPCYGQSNGFAALKNASVSYSYSLIDSQNNVIGALSNTNVARWSDLAPGQYKVKIDEGSCSWYSKPVILTEKKAINPFTIAGSDIRSPAVTGMITLRGKQPGVRYLLRDKNNLSKRFYFYGRKSNNELYRRVPPGQYEVVAGYDFGFDYCPGHAPAAADTAPSIGNDEIQFRCQSKSNPAEVRDPSLPQPSKALYGISTLPYQDGNPLPLQPSTTVTTSGCEVLLLVCNPSNSSWYWQTSESGTDTSHPSTVAFSAHANTAYYLRAYNGESWSSAFSHTPPSPVPAQPSTAVTASGCESLLLACNPSNPNWYWQTSANGTSTSHPSAKDFGAAANTTYYLRALNETCWSSAFEYSPSSPIPAQPSPAVTASGCESLLLACNPSNPNWYWQPSANGTSTSHPSAKDFGAAAGTAYYLRAKSGTCWSPAFSHTPDSPIPAQPSAAITVSAGCEELTLSCSSPEAGWYWQTSESGTDETRPASDALSGAAAGTTYYLRAKSGTCWSPAFGHTPDSPIPAQPSAAITVSAGCEELTLSCSSPEAGWYWQTSESGTDETHPPPHTPPPAAPGAALGRNNGLCGMRGTDAFIQFPRGGLVLADLGERHRRNSSRFLLPFRRIGGHDLLFEGEERRLLEPGFRTYARLADTGAT